MCIKLYTVMITIVKIITFTAPVLAYKRGWNRKSLYISDAIALKTIQQFFCLEYFKYRVAAHRKFLNAKQWNIWD